MFEPTIAPEAGQALVGEEPGEDLVEELAQDFVKFLAESEESEAGGDPRPPEGGELAGGFPAQRADQGAASKDAPAVARAFRPAAAASDASEGATQAREPGPGAQPTGAVEGAAPLLDRYGQSSTGTEWSRQQRRVYQRVKSILTYYEGQGYQVCWVMLSTASGGSKEKLAYHHKMLRQRIEREFGFDGLEYFQVRTAEGNGVLHILWAWRPKSGMKWRNFFVPQEWLSRMWEKIHGASIVWIARYKPGGPSKRRVSRYFVTQYCAGQGALEHMSWSWKRSFGFPLVKVWREFRGLYRWPSLYRGAVLMWEALMRGETVMIGGMGTISLDGLRHRYSPG